MRPWIGSRMLRAGIWFFFAIPGPWAAAQPATIDVVLRRQAPAAAGVAFRGVETPERWEAAETAVIVCDAWDLHHCKSAVERLEEFAPRMAAFVAALRDRGGTVIHAPSDCMAAYADHPARRRAADLAGRAPADTPRGWCHGIAAEAAAEYPLDQSLGGDDDPPATRAAWAEELRRRGADAARPWTRQTPLVPIDGGRDFISAAGDEIAGVLAARGIRNVLLVGVHANMCVLGRPFGLRRLVSAGRRVALVRDLTDTMYDPAAWPWVSHFTGNDLLVDHVERHVCPTITSDQLLAGAPFRFAADRRPTVVLAIGDDEYGFHRTLPGLATRLLGRSCRVVPLHADAIGEADPHSIPGLERLAAADVLVVAVRRRGLPAPQMAALRAFIAAGKPVVGIRTASHAWEPKKPVADRETWSTFDRDVFGVSYTGHHANAARSIVRFEAVDHPLLAGVPAAPLEQVGSLYKLAPVSDRTVVLARGEIPTAPPEPVVTLFTRPDGGLSVYTSIGHEADLAQPAVARLLANAVHLAAGLPSPAGDDRDPHDPRLRWVSVRRKAGALPEATALVARFDPEGKLPLACRTVVVGDAAAARDGLRIVVRTPRPERLAAGVSARLRDRACEVRKRDDAVEIVVPGGAVAAGAAVPLVVRIDGSVREEWLAAAAGLDRGAAAGGAIPAEPVPLDRWQIRLGGPADDPAALTGGPPDSLVDLDAADRPADAGVGAGAGGGAAAAQAGSSR